MKIQVTFLGTGTSMGVPVIGCACAICQSNDPKDKRLRTSVHIASANTSIVIDSGPDFRQQMLVNHVNKLDALLFTHEHKDHTAGMDDVRAYNFIQNRPMDIWASARVEEALRKDFHYAFAESKYPGVPEIHFHRIDGSTFTVGDLNVIPIEVLHNRLPVYGFRIGGFVYITDANAIPDEEWHKLEDAEVLVLNALRKTAHISHFTLDEAIEVSNKLQAKETYFTHISHQMGKHVDIEPELPKHMHLAYDGLKLVLN